MLGFGALSSLLTACASATSNSGAIYGDATSNLEAGRLVCDVNSLATQKDQIIQQREELRSVAGQETNSTALEKMQSFDASIDGEYRNVVASCRAYIQCMEMNSYNEVACHSAESRWRDSEQTFSQLSIALKPPAFPPNKAPPGGGPPRGPKLGKPTGGFPTGGFTGGPSGGKPSSAPPGGMPGLGGGFSAGADAPGAMGTGAPGKGG